jgi:hypothetical protein
VTRIDQAVADTSALLALVGVVPLEAPDVETLLAPDAALVEALAVLRAHHEGRPTDVVGDLAIVGLHVHEWLTVHDVATELAALTLAHADELVGDLLGLAIARQTELPLVTGLAHLALLERDTTVVVLPRTT